MSVLHTLCLLTFWASDFTWYAGWQQKLLGWTVPLGSAPFTGPVAFWLLTDAGLFVFGVVRLWRIAPGEKRTAYSVSVLAVLLLAQAATIYYQYQEIGGV